MPKTAGFGMVAQVRRYLQSRHPAMVGRGRLSWMLVCSFHILVAAAQKLAGLGVVVWARRYSYNRLPEAVGPGARPSYETSIVWSLC